MSASARAPYYAGNTASSTPSAGVFAQINRLMLAANERDRYEDNTEPRPSPVAIASAGLTLAGLDEDFRNACEIEPYWGQLSLVWRSGRGKRVKATFSGDGAASVYYEQMVEGRVTDSRMVTPQDGFSAYLASRLAWLNNTRT